LANSTLEVLANRLERAMQAGLLRDADPLQTAALVWATTHGVMSLELKTADRSLIDWPAVYDEALTMIIKGLS
jgi:AcrR family transcriptional regulator